MHDHTDVDVVVALFEEPSNREVEHLVVAKNDSGTLVCARSCSREFVLIVFALFFFFSSANGSEG